MKGKKDELLLYYDCCYIINEKNLLVMWSEKKDIKTSRASLRGFFWRGGREIIRKGDYSQSPILGQMMMTPANKTLTRRKRAGGFDLQKWWAKTGIEFHWPGYQYMGPGTKLKKRLKRGDPGINRLDKIAKQHDIDYSRAKNLTDKWKADAKMIKAIDKLPGSKTLTEKVVKRIVQAKKRLKL